MTKAQDFADRYLANPTKDEFTKICEDFVMETKTLSERRHCKTDSALFAVMNELDLKYQSFTRKVKEANGDELDTRGYRILMRAVTPEIYKHWMLYRTYASKRGMQ